jgi:thioredoxin reductase (NADPH)
VSPIRPEVTVIGRRLEPGDHHLRDFLMRTAQPFSWLEAGSESADAALAAAGADQAALPVLIEADGTVHGAASVRSVAEAWGAGGAPARDAYDLVIVGAGPAGLAASVYAASDGLSTLLVEEDVPGGQASHTSMIENFFGFPGGIGGAELARLAGRQAEGFGAELLFLHPVVGSRTGSVDDPFEVRLEGGCDVRADVVIAAPGMVWRRLDVEGIDELIGRGVYYGAGRSEAKHCANDRVVVVGAGNSAGQAVMNLANAGAQVTMVVRGDDLGKSMSAYLVDRIAACGGIDVRLRTQVTAVEAGTDGLAAVTLTGADGRAEPMPADALFLCIGGLPRTGWAPENGVSLDERGFVLTGPDLLRDGARPPGWPLDRDPLAVETSVPGFFVAGDARSGSTKRVAGAVGDGAMAVALAHRRLEELARARAGGPAPS